MAKPSSFSDIIESDVLETLGSNEKDNFFSIMYDGPFLHEFALVFALYDKLIQSKDIVLFMNNRQESEFIAGFLEFMDQRHYRLEIDTRERQDADFVLMYEDVSGIKEKLLPPNSKVPPCNIEITHNPNKLFYYFSDECPIEESKKNEIIFNNDLSPFNWGSVRSDGVGLVVTNDWSFYITARLIKMPCLIFTGLLAPFSIVDLIGVDFEFPFFLQLKDIYSSKKDGISCNCRGKKYCHNQDSFVKPCMKGLDLENLSFLISNFKKTSIV